MYVCLMATPQAALQINEFWERLFWSSIMILPQVHLRKPCYDFCPVQATAIKAVSTNAKSRKIQHQRSPLFSKRLSPGQRRAVCTKGRDVISVSWWPTLTGNSSFKGNNCNSRSRSRRILIGLPMSFGNGIARWFLQCSARAAPDI